MLFCPENNSMSNPWISDGVSQCFIQTIAISSYLGFILIFGSFHIFLIRRNNLSTSNRPKSIFFQIQMWSMILFPILALLRFFLQMYYLYDKRIYGYMILTVIGIIISYIIALIMVFQERKYHTENSMYGRYSIILIIFWILAFVSENLVFISFKSNQWWFKLTSKSDQIEFSFWIIRYVFTISILVLGLNGVGMRNVQHRFGRIQLNDIEEELPSTRSTWGNIVYKSKLVMDATWPRDSYILQLKILICVLILIMGRVLNLFMPITYKYVIDSLTPALNSSSSQYSNYNNKPFFESYLRPLSISVPQIKNKLILRWDLILLYGILRILQGAGTGSSGILNAIRTQLWITVQQYSSCRIAVQVFSHIHGLSLKWYLCKKTGEVLRVMGRGTDSLQNLLNYVLFNIVPTLFDILIGIIYFAAAFNLYFSLIVFITMFVYLGSTILITEWRTKYRRNMNRLDNEKSAKAVDSLLNFETVKYYGAEKHEVMNYRNAILAFQKADWISQTTLNVLNLVQGLAINVGFIVGAILCAYYIVNENRFTVGDFVLYCTYIVQLNAPLNFFGTYYR